MKGSTLIDTSLNDRFLAAEESQIGSGFALIREWYENRNVGTLKVACSLQREDIVIIHKLKEMGIPFIPYVLDTGRLHGETYWMIDRVRSFFDVDVELWFPDREKVEAMMRSKGAYSFKQSIENRHECCHIRKVESNHRALADCDAYITGMRRSQSITRTDLLPFTTDEGHGGICKLSPLVLWSEDDVKNCVIENGLPDHPLYQKGFTSIGCQPCTRPLQTGESDPRAGRWWWESPEHKECGLHFVYNEYN